MSRSAQASRALPAMFVSQIAIAIGQLIYSGVTARVLSPSDFGQFVAALSLQGLLLLLTTTGLPSAVLRTENLTSGSLRRFRLLAAGAGALSSIAYIAIMPLWAILLNFDPQPEMTSVLMAALLVAPWAQVESAVLRREHRTNADALFLVLAFALAASVATAAAIASGSAWALAVMTLLNPLILGFLSLCGHGRVRSQGTAPPPLREQLRYMRSVSTQNVVFYTLNQSPTWVVSIAAGLGALGMFSRASTLAAVLTTAITSPVNRVVQPHWRHLRMEDHFIRAFTDTFGVALSAALPIGAIAAAIGPAITRIWLGPGWDIAASLTTPLLIGSALAVPTTLALTAQEMRGDLREIRIVQIGLAATLAAGLFAFAITSDLYIAAWAVCVSQLAGLLTLVVRFSIRHSTTTLLSSSLTVGVWAVLIWLGCRLAIMAALENSGSFPSDWIALFTGATTGLGLFFLSCRWLPIVDVLDARGVKLPSVIIWRPRHRKR